MKFNKKFEEEILAQALKDIDYLKKASRILDTHHFNSQQFSWLWKVISDVWNKYRELASVRLILTRARVDFPKDEEREAYIELVNRLYRKKLKAPKATLDQLVIFTRTVNAQLSMEKAATYLEKNKLDHVYDTLRNLTRKDLKPRDYTKIDWIEEFEQRQQERREQKENPQEKTVIPTGFKRLDKIISGIQESELGLVLATTGKGKSVMLSNLAFTSVKRGFPTVYFALEMPARQIAMRQDARWLGMSYNKFKNYDFTPSELRKIDKKLKRIHKSWKGKLKIISMPLRRADINTIRGALDDLQTDEGFVPKLICIDSGDHLQSANKTESFRLQQTSVYWDLKTLAEDGFAVWSSTHAGREWAKLIATAEATGESYDKARIADIVLSLNTPQRKSRSTRIAITDSGEEVEEEENISTVGEYVELYLAKYRDGRSRVIIPMDAEFSRMFIKEIE